MTRLRFWVAVLITGLMGAGYLLAQDSAGARLKADIRYLASKELKGRKTGSGGAKRARQMIEARFKELGLAKWRKEKEYTVPFAYGTNVMGVLTGSDPVLASEIVLVSAHYDHVGEIDGNIHPGASDNASGVAAILEAARQLSQPGQRPRRTVAFVAFDSEEKFMVGSFAFSLRPDVTAAKLSAVVNVDMLGRKFLNVVDNAVFVAGGEGYPALRESLRGFGSAAALRVFPVGSDLAGERSDQVAFENRGVPVLFFSCGTFGDYHEPADTADRLDLGLVERSTRVILATVQSLANGPPIVRDPEDRWERDELQTLQPVFQEVIAQPKVAGIGPFVRDFQKLESEVSRYLRVGGYDWKARRIMILEATPALYATLGGVGAGLGSLKLELGAGEFNISNFEVKSRVMGYFNTTYPGELGLAYRAALAQVLKHRPGLLRTMPPFDYEVYRIDPRETRLDETSPGIYRLSAPAAWFRLVVNPRPSLFSFRTRPPQYGIGINDFAEEGSREALSDYWLLELKEHPQRIDQIRPILRLVLGAEPAADYATMAAQRLRQGSFHNESEWIAKIMRSQPGWLAVRAVKTAAKEPAPMRTALAALIRDRTAPADARKAAIWASAGLGGRELLTALCDVLDDPVTILDSRATRTSSPFSSSTIGKLFRMDVLQGNAISIPPPVELTIGDNAWDTLQGISETRLPKEAALWRAWVAKHPNAKANNKH